MEMNFKYVTKKTALISIIILTIVALLAIVYFGFSLLLLIFAALLISLLFEFIIKSNCDGLF
mgnify:CR=1 FL=1